MRKEKITSLELKRLIALKANKLSYEDVTEEDFDEITELVFNANSFSGEKTEISLDWITLFPNLESIRIIGFDVDQTVIDNLSNQMRLTAIEFSKCKMYEITFEGLNGRLKRAGFAGCGSLDFKYPDVPYVYVSNSEIDFNNIDFEKVKGITILGSKIKNGHNIEKYPDIQNVYLDGSVIYDEEENEIPNIEVSKMTKYSHRKEIELVDTER